MDISGATDINQEEVGSHLRNFKICTNFYSPYLTFHTLLQNLGAGFESSVIELTTRALELTTPPTTAAPDSEEDSAPEISQETVPTGYSFTIFDSQSHLKGQISTRHIRILSSRLLFRNSRGPDHHTRSAYGGANGD